MRPSQTVAPWASSAGHAGLGSLTMDWHFQYTPAIWPSLACAAFVAALGTDVWRRRAVAGARPLAWMLLLTSLWALGTVLELAAVEAGDGILWAKFSFLWLLPMATARLCFALEYANPGRSLTRPVLTLLVLPPVLVDALILTNDLHQGIWLGFSTEGYVRALNAPAGWAITGYAYLLTLAGLLLLARLYLRSPMHRLPVALIVCAQIIAHAAFAVDAFDANPLVPVDLTVLAAIASSSLYALALFRFRMFDPIPIARETVIEQMHEGMLVLDSRQRVVDLNRAAEAMLGLPRAHVLGLSAADLLPGTGGSSGWLQDLPGAGGEVSLGTGDTARVYSPYLSPLQDPRGSPLGTLILLHDVTDQKRAQAQVLEQQRLVATLRERQQLARELHDGVAQVLSYVSLQARAIHKWIDDGDLAAAQSQSLHLAGAAQDAHADIRDSIRDLRVGSAPGWSLFVTLRQHLDSFTAHSGIRTALVIAPGLEQDAFGPETVTQLLWVVQEAMTNARKHSAAASVQVTLDYRDEEAQVTVADDGCGFDPTQSSAGPDGHLGLAYMHERMTQIGGSLAVRSQPGAGTQVIFRVPIRTDVSRTVA